MFASTAGVESRIWDDGRGNVVEYALDALDEVRRISVDGFNAFAHGGLEAGGVLYGSREPDRILVLGCAALDCEHAHGPGFLLSESDRNKFALLLKPPDGMETVGWFRAHNRSSLDLDVNDRELFDR